MKRFLMLAALSTGLLASCNTGSAPDGSGSGTVSGIKTEFKTDKGQFVACDKVIEGDATRTTTNLAINFSAKGSIKDIEISLKGRKSSDNNSNYIFSVSGQQLKDLGTNKYKMLIEANSHKGPLPAGIIIKPTTTKIKTVSVKDRINGDSGGFYANLMATTTTSKFSFDSSSLGSNGNIPVYGTCTVKRVTNEEL